MGTPAAAWMTRDVVVCSGADAVSFLAGQVSADVAAMGEGDVRHTFVLAPDGKVVSWGYLLRRAADEVILVVAAGFGEPSLERLSRFKIRVDVDISLETDVAVLAIRGDGSQALAARCGGRVVDLDFPPDDDGTIVAAVDVMGSDVTLPDGVSEDPTAVERFRIRSGFPQLGADIRAGDIPAEAGVWVVATSASFTKGCYVGQELVARVDSRGSKVPRRNCRIDVDGPVVPGDDVEVDESVVGEVSSAVEGTALARIGRAVPVGAEVRVAGRPGVVRRDLGA